MDWNTVWSDVVSGAILLGIGSAGGWFTGLLKGKKESSDAIKRKNDIYQPLINELEQYAQYGWDIMKKIDVKLLNEMVNNSYKYALPGELLNKCNYLYQMIMEYNNIHTVGIAHDIIVDIFTKSYETIYGSVIEGISYHSDPYGNEWEEEEIVEPVKVIREIYYTKDIENLLCNEGMYSDEVCIDYENGLFEPIYGQLKGIYSGALNVSVNGEKYKNPKPIIDMDMSPAEYMAYHYDFFQEYNDNEKIKSKYKLQEEIIYTSQAIVQELKDIIEKIVRIYEVEKV